MQTLLFNYLLTNILEGLVFLPVFRRQLLPAALFLVLLNLFTLPLATLAVFRYDVNWYIVELCVALSEALMIWFFWNRGPVLSFAVAFGMNALSAFFYPVLDWIKG